MPKLKKQGHRLLVSKFYRKKRSCLWKRERRGTAARTEGYEEKSLHSGNFTRRLTHAAIQGSAR
jgi:hypothetical protein